MFGLVLPGRRIQRRIIRGRCIVNARRLATSCRHVIYDIMLTYVIGERKIGNMRHSRRPILPDRSLCDAGRNSMVTQALYC